VASYTESVKSRKWVWIGAGALCAFVLLCGYLARPVDELAGLMRLHPHVEVYPPLPGPPAFGYEAGEAFCFTQSQAEVLALMPGRKVMDFGYELVYRLPSGRDALFCRSLAPSRTALGETCAVRIFDDNRPWYRRVWATIRSRLGL